MAPPECPSEQQFRELVRARMLGAASAGESGWNELADNSVSVEVRLEPAQHRATLLLEEPNLSPLERVVSGDTCDELAAGVALITALAFGAARETASATARATPQAAEPQTTAKTSEPAPAPPEPAQPEKLGTTTRGERAASAGRLAIGLGAGAWVNTWSAPNGALGADLFVRLAPAAGPGWSLRASGLFGGRTISVGDRVAEFRFIGGRAEGCPLSRNAQRLSGEACLALELGAVSGSGRESSALLVANSDTVFSATALLTCRIRAHLGERFFVEGQGDLGLPLLPHEFVFEQPSERIFRTPVLGFSARLGLGMQFP